MSERLSAIGGRLSLGPAEGSGPGHGFRLIATVPATHVPAAAGDNAHNCKPMTQDEPVRLLLAEDQVMIREALAALLSFEGDIEVVVAGRPRRRGAEGRRGHPSRRGRAGHRDAGMDGLAAAAELKKRSPDIKIVILTTFRPARVSSAARWSPGCPRSWSGLTGGQAQPRPSAGCWPASGSSTRTWPSPRSPTGVNPLTPRERDVLDASAERPGRSPRSPPSSTCPRARCGNYLSACIQKTGARNRAEALRIASERGWLIGPETLG